MRRHRVFIGEIHTNQMQKGAHHNAVPHAPMQKLWNMPLITTTPIVLTFIPQTVDDLNVMGYCDNRT